ncbi:carbonic anhydrase [Catalinimonas alkaloidigena]|uniref:carbonic anhydrase n=1 Tax=Catalinimonas alkaloidigena TaxID=1075417 RepID=UPI002405942E|nr:carbonic anhydrase [Catalinimonas alkaloidigena]MDF9800104.1 carbonic anhydrase [Catalinimonas alkaloidigena]
MKPTIVPAEEALKRLQEGNQRFVAEKRNHAHEDNEYRVSLSKGQDPFAVILACADSRVTPEILFDQGLGDLFVIRVAGNVAKEKVTGSIEYAVAHLGVRLVMVLGHQNCGAVGASMGVAELSKNLQALVNEIKPAVHMAEKSGEKDVLNTAVRYNAQLVAAKLSESQPTLYPAVENEGLKIVPAYYKLETGEVELL